MTEISYVKHQAELIRATEGTPSIVIASTARVCRDGAESLSYCEARKLCRKLLGWGHMSPFEFFEVTFACVTNRAVSHELVRHRLASYMQESQRYCAYDKELPVVPPQKLLQDKPQVFQVWADSIRLSYKVYQALIAEGLRPEDARTVLPEATATKILVKMNLRELRHFLTLRTSNAAWTEMRMLAKAMKAAFFAAYPDELYLLEASKFAR